MDGEGCLDWNSGPRVRISNTYLSILNTAVSLFGGAVSQKQLKPGGRDRPAWEWRISGTAARAFLRLVLPYLVEKREQARLLLLAWAEAPANRPPLLARMTTLKRAISRAETE